MKILPMTIEKEAVQGPLRVSAAINQLDGSLNFGENPQLLCHVEALRLRKVLGTELQERDQNAALISQILIKGKSAQHGLDHLAGFWFIPGIGMIEPT